MLGYRATYHAQLFWVCHWPLPPSRVIRACFPGESELWSASEICFSFPPLFLGIPACLLSHLSLLLYPQPLSSLSH